MAEPLDPQKVYAYVPISREMAIDAGIIEPTPEEKAERAELSAKWEARRAAATKAVRDWEALSLQVLDPLAKVILRLHRRNDRGDCDGCDVDGYDAEQPRWPCVTYRTVMAHLGYPVPDDYEDGVW